jgi:DNA-binding transcriptional regulator YiaG
MANPHYADWRKVAAISPAEYERLLAALGLNQSSGARFLGVSDRTSRRYVAGEAEVPASAVKLLRLMLHLRLGPRHRIAARPQGQLDARA